MTRTRLPERDRCPRCGTQVGVLAARVHMPINGGERVLVVITHACPYTARGAGRRCGQPYAMVIAAGRPLYVFADTFEQLEAELIRRYGPEASWTR